LAALARVFVQQDALVPGVGAKPVGPKNLSDGRVEEQQNDQTHDRHRDAT
jgi:hypothetical protein